MKKFVLPWLPALLLVWLLLLTLLFALLDQPSASGFIFDFIYGIPFHLLALAAYCVAVYYILVERRRRQHLYASLNCLLSLYAWYSLTTFVTSSFTGQA